MHREPNKSKKPNAPIAEPCQNVGIAMSGFLSQSGKQRNNSIESVIRKKTYPSFKTIKNRAMPTNDWSGNCRTEPAENNHPKQAIL